MPRSSAVAVGVIGCGGVGKKNIVLASDVLRLAFGLGPVQSP